MGAAIRTRHISQGPDKTMTPKVSIDRQSESELEGLCAIRVPPLRSL